MGVTGADKQSGELEKHLVGFLLEQALPGSHRHHPAFSLCCGRMSCLNEIIRRKMRVNLKTSIVLIATVLMTPSVWAAGIDLHWLWHDRCADCHGHSADFARKFLSVSGDELQGWHHVYDLRRFLHYHYLAGNEVDAVYNMLLAQAGSQARFKGECSSCHDTAVNFVRETMVFHDGVLFSRASGYPVRDFLAHHRNLEPDDVDFFMKVLTRVAHEVYRP